MIELRDLLQVARELDDEAESPPCSEAKLLRDAAAEIAHLRTTNATQKETINSLIAVLGTARDGVILLAQLGKILDETLNHA